MKKTLMVLLVIAIVVVSMLAFGTIPAKAATEYTSGNYTYSVSNGEATITDVNTSISGSITIPSTLGGYPVTSIDDFAFYNCSSLTSVEIPDSVTSIGYAAFRGCSSLTSVEIPDSVTSIGEDAFYNTGYYNNSTNWENNVLYINSYLIDAKTSITGNYIVKNGTKIIADSAFYRCSRLTSVTIPDSVTSIDDFAFAYCSSLTSVVVPNSVTSIGDRAFYDCSSLESINVDTSNKNYSSISGVLFNKDKTTLLHYPAGKSTVSYSIPDSVTSIGYAAFRGCSSLTSVEIPDSVTSIGSYAFYNCSKLTSVEIGDGVTSIGDYAFENCSSLESVIIGDGVTSIGGSAFRGCSSLESITLPFVGAHFGYIFGASSYSYNYAYVPTSLKEVVITGGTSIGGSAFSGCSSLTSITIPDSVTSIGYNAFYGCSKLLDVYYAGTIGQWNSISVGSGNQCLTNAKIHAKPGAKNGWQYENNTWYYYENGVKVKNAWREDSTGWCFLDTDGKWVINAFVKDSTNKWAYITPDGYYYETTGWVEYKGNWYYLEKGYRVENDWRKDSTGWCFLNENGIWVLNTFVKDSTGMWAYITPDGYYYETTGWVQLGSDWYYLENGYRVENDWRKDSNGWCFLDEKGKWLKDTFVLDSTGKWAYITKDGYYYETTGWVEYIGEWYYLEKGYAVTNDWRLDSKGWCYLGEDGAMLTSTWLKDSVGWCYIDENGYCLANGKFTVDGHEYTFDADGRIEGEPIQE